MHIKPLYGKYVVYASDYAKLDSHVVRGGGTDDTSILQQILDMAPVWGGLHLIMDGAALMRGLYVQSNTTIECSNADCGFYLADDSNTALLRNIHPDFRTIQDHNIRLLGGTYNHNCPHQKHDIPEDYSIPDIFPEGRWMMAMEFYGVENLLLRDVTIRNQRTFAMLVANWRHVVMENIHIDLPDLMDGQNQDGLHFWGPGEFLTLRNIRGCSGDDFIALAPDEHDKVSSITDVLIDWVHLDNADQGVRMLSRGTGRLDRVTLRNVSGTYKSFGFYINSWFPGSTGSFGNILIENVDLRQTYHKYHYATPFLFRLGGHMEHITLRNIRHHLPNDARALLQAGWAYYDESETDKDSSIDILDIDGLTILEKDDAAKDAEYMLIKCPVNIMNIRHVTHHRTTGSRGGCLLKTLPGAHIGRLTIHSIQDDGWNAVVEHEAGSIDTVQVHDLLAEEGTSLMHVAQGTIGTIHEGSVLGG